MEGAPHALQGPQESRGAEVTRRELENLLGSVQPAKTETIDAGVLESAEIHIDALEQGIGAAQSRLVTLAALFEDFTLIQAILGAQGQSLEDARSQLRALREAARDAAKGAT